MINCECGCGIKIPERDNKNRTRRFVKGHHNYLPREVRACACDCGQTFTCITTNPKRYIKNHQNKLVGFQKGYEPYNKGVSSIPKNINEFIEGGKKTRFNGSIKGEVHPRYIDGRTPEMQLLRQKFRQTVSPSVLKRDNYTCVWCDQRGGELHIDHIKDWTNYPELRFDIENCRTLCVKCHYKRTFGSEMPSNSSWGITKKVRY